MMKMLPWMYNHEIIFGIAPSMRYNGEESFEAWQTKARETLRFLLGMDKLYPAEDKKFNIEYIKKMYEAAGAPDKCVLVTGDGGHRFYADPAWPEVHRLNSGF